MDDTKSGMSVHEVDHFYLCHGAITGQNTDAPELIAASTVYSEDDLEIVYTLNTKDDYQQLLQDVTSLNDLERVDGFSRIWYNMTRQDRTLTYTNLTMTSGENVRVAQKKVQAIRVNMNARVKVNAHIEKGGFDSFTGSTPTDVERNFTSVLDVVVNSGNSNDIRKVPAFDVTIDVIYNDIGSLESVRKPQTVMRRVDNVVRSLPCSHLIVPYKTIKCTTITEPAKLLEYFSNKVSCRTKPYKIEEDFEPSFVRVEP